MWLEPLFPWPRRAASVGPALEQLSHTRSQAPCSRYTLTPEGIPAGAPA
ncbi:hypothetical protein CyaNS01_01455 [Cyanobium sp. NS01]|nr:hypothetical protein CyaNS01_01455 [Cyanobium sp. NS01]